VGEAVELGMFAVLARSSTALLTTFRPSGEAVSTPVSVALRSGRAYFVTAAGSGKTRRLARCERVDLTPCTVTGAPMGNITVAGRGRPLEGAAARALGLLRPTGPLFWSWLLYRLRGHSMRFYEVHPVEGGAA
jgi:PPOX class probable F420-dependent enzyme